MPPKRRTAPSGNMPEFDLIRQIERQTRVSGSGVIEGIGDDAAVLELPAGQLLVAAVDTMNAGVHFPADSDPSALGHKCLAINLSDLAAMGAEPRWALLALSLPREDAQWLRAFTAGFRTLAAEHRVALVGGDTTAGPLSISVTALGLVRSGRQLLRSGAKPGELLAVSGTLGAAARTLDLLQTGAADVDRGPLDRPQPRVALGRALAGLASACIDISDGLLADLGHLVDASGVGARVEVGSLPADPLLEGLGDAEKWRCQLSGGDDYELLFTLPAAREGELAALSATVGVPLSVIGRIEAGGGIHCIAPGGGEIHSGRAGFEHFRPET